MNLNNIKYNTLIKLITFIKFNCDDNEAAFHAGSPIVGELLKELIVEFNKKIKRDISFEVNSSVPIYNLVIKGIKKNLERTVEWSVMNNEAKSNHIKNLGHPYIIDNDELELLSRYADNWHLNNNLQ